MGNNSLDVVASYSALDAAWRELWGRSRPNSRNTIGVDGASINDFARDPKPRLRAISSQIRNGDFTFSRLRPHLVVKPSGKYRLICVPTINDRIVQRALLDFLTNKYGSQFKNKISYGFIKGRTVVEAATQACKLRREHGWAFKTDITAFFDRVSRPLLHQKIRSVIKHRALHDLLIAASDCEIDKPSGVGKKKIAELGIKEGVGVRQGMPLSPFFANLFLEPFDREIQKANLEAVRYADDLIFFADSDIECNEIAKFCRNALDKLDLQIPDFGPDSKSRIADPDEVIEFLGLGLKPGKSGYDLVVMESQRNAIKQELLRFSSIRYLLERNIRLDNFGQSIESRISGYLHAYESCTNYSELSNELEDLHQTILRRIYGVDGLGINLNILAPEKKTFLGLS